MTDLVTEDQALARFKGVVDSYPSKGAAAKDLGIHFPNLSDMLHSKRPLSQAALNAIKLERVTLYRHKETTDAQQN